MEGNRKRSAATSLPRMETFFPQFVADPAEVEVQPEPEPEPVPVGETLEEVDINSDDSVEKGYMKLLREFQAEIDDNDSLLEEIPLDKLSLKSVGQGQVVPGGLEEEEEDDDGVEESTGMGDLDFRRVYDGLEFNDYQPEVDLRRSELLKKRVLDIIQACEKKMEHPTPNVDMMRGREVTIDEVNLEIAKWIWRNYQENSPKKPKKFDAKTMFKTSLLYKQMKEVAPEILKTLQLTSENGSPYDKCPGKFDIRQGNFYQKLSYNNRQVLREKRVEICPGIYQIIQKGCLGQQFRLFTYFQNMTDDQIRIRWQLALDIFLILKKEYPKLELEITGSFLLGLGDGQNALDIAVHLETGKKVGNWMKWSERVSTILEKNGKMFSGILPRVYCGLPVLQLKHGKSDIVVNLLFGNKTGLESNKLLRNWVQVDPRVKAFLQLLRYWARFHLVTSPGFLNNYLLSLLAVTFLVKKKIVVVPGKESEARKDVDNSEEDDDVENVLKMTLEFCEMFEKWDPKRDIVCPVLGKVFKCKAELMEGKLPRRSMEQFPKLRQVKWEKFLGDKVVVLDLMDLNCNAASGLTEEIVRRFKMACGKTGERIRGGVNSLLELFWKLDE